MMLQAHYRSPINYTLEVIQQCQASLKRIYNCKEKLTLTLAKAPEGAMTQEQKDTIDGFRQQFITAMDDDFNTADAVSASLSWCGRSTPTVTAILFPAKSISPMRKPV